MDSLLQAVKVMNVESYRQFYLMNKDKPIVKFEFSYHSSIDYWFEEIEVLDNVLPIDYVDIESFLLNRKAPSSRKHINMLLNRYNCNTLIGYITYTHCVSLNDTFWVKEVSSELQWKDVSPYCNKLNELVSEMAFSGEGKISDLAWSPEFSTNGRFPKRWIKEDSGIYLIKGGTKENDDIEPLLECIASKVYNVLCSSSVEYTYTTFKNKPVSKCSLFTNEDEGIISLSRLSVKPKYKDIQALYGTFDKVDELNNMLIADAVVRNTDRHLGNIALTVNNDTQQLIDVSRVYDYNCSLCPEINIDMIEKDVIRYIRNLVPRIDADFTQTSRQLLTLDVKEKLLYILELVVKNSLIPMELQSKLDCRRMFIINKILEVSILDILSL